MPQSFAEQLRSIPMSPNLGQSLERAHRFAREQSHRVVTLEHLLLALAEDPEAALILQSANVDLARLGTDVSRYLGGLLEDMRTDGTAEPRPDAELLRVLQAAASAAQQSKRRQIDGAIVLAAIVGDGKNPAAGLLKAHGMTFEEAIRALQRANTKARLKPASKTPAPTAPTADDAANQVAAQTAAAVAAAPVASPPPVADGAAAGQSAEDILAAARARIQQRSGKPAAAPAAPAQRTPAPNPAWLPRPGEDEPAPTPDDPAETDALTSAIEAAMSAPAVRRTEPPAPQPPPVQVPPAAVEAPFPPAPPRPPAWTPPPDPRGRPVAATRPPLPNGRALPPGPPLMGPPLLPGEGALRPPLPPPPRAAGAGPPPSSLVHRLPQVPWSDPGERGGAVRAPPQRAGQSERGPLVENIPRHMRVGVAVGGEVRIARDKLEGLLVALNGSGQPYRAGSPLARALSVRLRAPNGGFMIEAVSPETQWVEGATSLIHDDDAVWRWSVVPQRPGRSRLLLMVSARSVGPDGVVSESAPPDRAIDVKVRANYARALVRVVGWTMVLLAGGLIGRFSEPLWPSVAAATKRLLGG
jgi:neural Wiskott-Aldrich syndrome protein